MFKKLLFLFFVAIFFSQGADAATFKMTVEVLEPFSLKNPPKSLAVQVLGDYTFGGGENVENGTLLTGDIVKIVKPKRAKRNGYFYYKLTSYTKPGPDSETVLIQNEKAIVKATSYTPLDKKELALNVGTSVAGFFVKNICYPINFVRGVVEPYEDKGRLKSGVQKVYEESPLSYVSEGRTIELQKGGLITLTFEYEKVD